MLDTNICIYVIKKNPKQVVERFRTFKTGEIGISAITFAELCYGVEKSQQFENNQIALTKFLMPLEVSAFDEMAAQHYGEIRTYLERQGQTIGSMDMLIGAHARSLGVPLVTNNTREFARLPHLKMENWV